jgi:REP element-mobilizing transposase RayT
MEDMPRKPRAEHEPGLYHVFARGVRKSPIYLDEPDRWRYLKLLHKTVDRTAWMLLSYCLMGNHVHLLIETREPNLGAGMHRLHGAYAQWFNRRHGFVGHVFQNRYESVTITNDPQLWVTAAYIARNPVTAGFCATPEKWQWSSHAGIVNDRAPEWLDRARLAAYFASSGGDGITRYADFVTASAHLNGDSPPLGGVYGPEESERRSGRTNQKADRRRATAAGAA